MLADQDALVGDQLVGSFFFGCLIVPGTGEGNFHRCAFADGAGAQEEGGVTGNNLGVGVSADITDLRFFCRDVAGFDHLVQLHTCGNTGQETAFINRSKCIVIVVQSLGVCLRACCVTELHFREFLGSLDHVIFMTEAVGKDDGAAAVSKFCRSVVALLALGHVRFQNDLILGKTQSLGCFFCAVDEVEVVGGVLVMQENKSYLHSAQVRLFGRDRCCHSRHGKDQSSGQCQCCKFFHVLFPP